VSERGVFAVDRGLFDHPLFADEALTEREAWLWLVSEAAWKPRQRRVDGKVVSLSRGQLCHSLRFMATAWKWSKSRTERFMSRLEEGGMITREHGTRLAVVTVCNYNKFQRVALPDRDNTGTTPGQHRDKLEDIKTIEQNTEIEARASTAEVIPLKPKPVLNDRGHRIPDDFTLTAERIEIARRIGLADDRVQSQFDRFRDHWLQADSPSARKRNWDAAWRNWVREAADRLERSRGNAAGGYRQADEGRFGAYQRAASRFANKDVLPE
jgi:hypothetical protein